VWGQAKGEEARNRCASDAALQRGRFMFQLGANGVRASPKTV
jgi:hypothetical protein